MNRFSTRRVLAALVVIVGMVAGAAPAEAAGGGLYSTTMSVSPGIPTDPTAAAVNNNLTFATTATTVAVAYTSGSITGSYAGPLSIHMTGRSTDTSATGTGTILTMSGSGSVASTSMTLNLVSGPDPNEYIRTGANVIIWVWVRVCFGSWCRTVRIHIYATLTPLNIVGTPPNAVVASAALTGVVQM